MPVISLQNFLERRSRVITIGLQVFVKNLFVVQQFLGSIEIHLPGKGPKPDKLLGQFIILRLCSVSVRLQLILIWLWLPSEKW